jgi:hypothetical protein
MSGADSSQGPGWWQASDGRWYPPEQKPGVPPPRTPPAQQPAPTPPTMAGPGPSGMPAAAPLGAGGGQGGDGGFFGRLFDMSFTRFVTPSLIKVLFILSIVVVSIYALLILVVGAANAGDGGIFLVIIAPIAWLVGIIYSRVLLELAIVFFRIEVNTRSQT